MNLHPKNSDPALLGACALAALGQRERARTWADRALAIDPDDPQAQYNVACVYSLIGEFEPVFDILEKVLPSYRSNSTNGSGTIPILTPSAVIRDTRRF